MTAETTATTSATDLLISAWHRVYGDGHGWIAFKTAVDEGRHEDALRMLGPGLAPGRIPWRPIAELPDELKDGREVLLWCEDSATTAVWIDYEGGYIPEGKFANWTDERGPLGFLTVTHFAEITPP